MRRKWKCTQAKQSSIISSSANRSSKQRSLEKPLSRLWWEETRHNPSHSFARVYHAEKAWGAPRWGCGELLAPSAQHWGAGFPHPAPRMAAETSPGEKSHPDEMEENKLQCRYTTSPRSAALLEELHWLLHTQGISPPANTPNAASALQRPQWLCRSLKHNFLQTARQQPVSTLSAHPNYNCTRRRLSSYLKNKTTTTKLNGQDERCCLSTRRLHGSYH